MNHSSAAGDFLALAKALLLAGNSLPQAASIAENTLKNTRAAVILKAAIEAGSTSDPSWAGALVEHQIAAAGFVGTLQSISVFDALMASMRRMPLRTRIAVATSSATGSNPGEGKPVPVSKLTLAGGSIAPELASALLVLTEETVRSGTAAADSLIAAELRKAVSSATNRPFLTGLMSGAPNYAAVGETPPEIYADLAFLAGEVSPTGTSKLHIVVAPATAVSLAFKTTTEGLLAFPDMTPNGGSIGGTPVLVSGDLEQDSTGPTVLMIDADSVAAGDDGITLDSSKAAALQMDDDPVDGAANLVSMFQTHALALKANRWFAFEKLRATGCAYLTGVEW